MRVWIAWGWAPSAIARATLECLRSETGGQAGLAQRRGDVVVPPTRGDQRVPRLVGEDQPVDTRVGKGLEMAGQQFGGDRRDRDRADRGQPSSAPCAATPPSGAGPVARRS